MLVFPSWFNPVLVATLGDPPTRMSLACRDTAISAVLPTIGGLDGWKCRLATRARLTSDETEHTRKRPRCMYSGMSNDFNRRAQLAT